MSERYLNIPDGYGGVLAGQLLEKIEKMRVTENQHVVIVLVGCETSNEIGTVAIPWPNSPNVQTGATEANLADTMIRQHSTECPNRKPDHNIGVIIRRISPERLLNAPAEASNLSILFNKMLQSSGN